MIEWHHSWKLLLTTMFLIGSLTETHGQTSRWSVTEAGGAVVAQLPFTARYKVHHTFLGEYTRPIRLNSRDQWVQEGAKLVVESNTVELSDRAFRPNGMLFGLYEIEGLNIENLVKMPWSFKSIASPIRHGRTIGSQVRTTIAEFDATQFARICFNDEELPEMDLKNYPVYATLYVDGKPVQRRTTKGSAITATWRNGCVDLAGSKFSVGLVRIIPVGEELPDPSLAAYWSKGEMSFAALDKIQSQTEVDKARDFSPPMKSGIFWGDWQLDNSVQPIAHFDTEKELSNFPHYALSSVRHGGKYDQLVNHLHFYKTVDSDNSNTVRLPVGGGYLNREDNWKKILIAPASVLTSGKAGLIGIDRSSYHLEESFLRSRSESVLALFKTQQLVRVCLKVTSKETYQTPLGMWIFIDGKPIATSRGLPISINYGCLDTFAKSVIIQSDGQPSPKPGWEKVDVKFFHRGIPPDFLE